MLYSQKFVFKPRCTCLLIALFLFANAFAQQNSFTVCSWNLLNLGRTKSDAEIEFIAKTVKDFDIVMIQEVVAKDPAGAQAVGRLGEALKRMGANWEYRISDITSGENSYKRERYAFLWKPSKAVLLGKPWLEQNYHVEVDREPFMATFIIGMDTVTLLNFHAITATNQPETEVKYFKLLPAAYPDLNIIFSGDFNLIQSHTVFNPLKKMGYAAALIGQKTSMKKSCVGEECLSKEFDNYFYDTSKLVLQSSSAIHFYKSFEFMEDANHLSDHLPIAASFGFINANEP